MSRPQRDQKKKNSQSTTRRSGVWEAGNPQYNHDGTHPLGEGMITMNTDSPYPAHYGLRDKLLDRLPASANIESPRNPIFEPEFQSKRAESRAKFRSPTPTGTAGMFRHLSKIFRF